MTKPPVNWQEEACRKVSDIRWALHMLGKLSALINRSVSANEYDGYLAALSVFEEVKKKL